MSGMENNLIKCSEVRELFSLFLDGETSPEEHDLLTGHLLLCEDCRLEFDLWKKISETLRTEDFHEEPSAGFSSRVINRLENEQKVLAFPGRKLFHTWRAPAAAAVAAVMLFAGSWGIGAALKDDAQKPVITANYTQLGETGNDVITTGPGETVTPGGQTNSDNPGQPADTPKDTGEGVEPGAQVLTADSGPKKQANNTVLLSSNKDIVSTTLKISTANPSSSKDIAIQLASGLGGEGQVFGNQKNKNADVTIIRLTVPKNNGLTLVSQLAGLGGIIDRTDEKVSITSQYNSAVNKLADIQATIDAGTGAGEKSRLEAEASVLKRQIEKWDKEAESYAVILWLQQQ